VMHPESSDQKIEETARIIYDSMRFDRIDTTPEWEERGNSLAQDEARRCARKLLSHSVDP
jgi:hypothetical protein